MHSIIVVVAGVLSPLILTATLCGIWKEGRSRNLMLRMLPPERRPGWNRPITSGDASTNCKPQSRPLWTLRDCQMELLTEGVIHAFEANTSVYQPDRVAVNYPPRRAVLERAKARASDRSSILLRTLERGAGALAAGGAAKSSAKPEIDNVAANTPTYAGLARPAHSQGVA